MKDKSKGPTLWKAFTNNNNQWHPQAFSLSRETTDLGEKHPAGTYAEKERWHVAGAQTFAHLPAR
jgi:hypothetical protein